MAFWRLHADGSRSPSTFWGFTTIYASEFAGVALRELAHLYSSFSAQLADYLHRLSFWNKIPQGEIIDDVFYLLDVVLYTVTPTSQRIVF